MQQFGGREQKRAWTLGLFLLAVAPAACAKHGENAASALNDVDAACARQDQDGARQILREAAENNPLFREAYEASKTNWQVTDDAKVNPCGIFLADLKKRLRSR